jgi:hypothetical protein
VHACPQDAKKKRRVKMDTDKTTIIIPIDVRIIISALWAARMLSSIHGDVVRMLQPGMLEEMIAGTTAVTVTNELLLVMSIIMAIPIFMSVLSLTLRKRANRRVNLGIGIFFVAFDLVFLCLTIFVWLFSATETFWAITYLVFTSLVVWFAWKWPKKEA